MKTKTVKIEGTIYLSLDEWSFGEIRFLAIDFNSTSWEKNKEWVAEMKKIAPYTIEIEIPDDIDLHKAKLTSLQNKRKLILAENEQRLNAIDNEISNLLAIENKEAA